MAVMFLTGTATATLAKDSGGPIEMLSRAPGQGELLDDRPAGSSSVSHLRADTLIFGGVAGDGFAIAGGIWDWDEPLPGDPLDGWYGVDITEQDRAWFRHITASIWTNGDGGGPTGNEVAAPLLNGAGSLWVGAFENEADDLCWESGLGYGNAWCQRAVSPVLEYDGTGNIALEFEYFNDTEVNFDYTRVLLHRVDSAEEVSLNFDGFTGQLGVNTDGSLPSGVVYVDVITPGDLSGSTEFQIIFEMTSDGGWSDEDGSYATNYSAFGADDVELVGNLVGGDELYTFNGGLEGWTAGVCPGFQHFMGVAPLSNYVIEDPCDCDLAGNVLEFHDDEGSDHPYGQHAYGVSNPVNVLRDVTTLPTPGFNLGTLSRWDQYSVMPRANGVFYRPGWDYYPFICPQTGAVQWSGRQGQDNFYYAGNDPVCAFNGDNATADGIPGVGIEQVRFLFEVYASCDAFGIPETICTDVNNFTPIIDNVTIRFTDVADAPQVNFASGTEYQDTYAITDLLDPNAVGRADIVLNTNFGNTPPLIGGDSLYVAGPLATVSTSWESRLWFRINREGPGTKPPKYNTWKTRLGDSKNITGGEFTFAWMDSFHTANGTQTAKNKFVSYLRETGEDDFNWDGATGEQSEANEIIRDDILVAGTGIDYFVTSNYTVSPTKNYVLPDTAGAFFLEFSVLPNWVNDGGLKFPCLLYVDAYNQGSEFFITNALNTLDLQYDKYDYRDPSSNWKNPMARGATNAEMNGVPLPQLLGYKAILVNTGVLGGQCMWPEDFILLGDWMTAIICNSNLNRQGFIMNGDTPATFLTQTGAGFLTTLGARALADAYNGFGGTPDENFCVRLDSPLVPGKYGTVNSINNYDYDAYGNWCPQQFSYDVLATQGTGTGNRAYINVSSSTRTNYAQIANQVDAAAGGNFRSVIDGVSYHHMSERAGSPPDECAGDSASVVTAAFNEIAAALEWMFGVGGLPALCVNPCTVVDAPDVTGFEAGSTRLYQNSPNPFNPRTVLRFSLAQTGHAELAIYDVNGRLVKTLVDGRTEAGMHEVVWDGTDASGNPVASGVFWSQLSSDGFRSNKKMVVLR
jgi:hypothetical protein